MSRGANIVATIDATFEATSNIDAVVDSSEGVTIDLGAMFNGGGTSKILYNTMEYWTSHPDIIAQKGYLYVYSDWKKDDEGKNIAGIKVGDGSSYLIDIPFTDQIWADHVSDVIAHITQEEREFWNNKVRCYIDVNDPKHLIFTTR
jgi:hypothetical protein